MKAAERTAAADCAFPPHPGEAAPRPVPRSARGRVKDWHMAAPAERFPLTALAAGWPSAWVMHAAHLPWGVTGLGSAVSAAAVWAIWKRLGKKGPHPRLAAAEAAAACGACGAWMTAATAASPLGWPGHLLTLAYVAGGGAGYQWIRTHDAVRAARKRRADRAADLARRIQWHRFAADQRLHGTHLLKRTPTFIGEEWLIKVDYGSGTTADAIIGDRKLPGQLAQFLDHLNLPRGRIDFSATEYDDQVLIGIRTADMTKLGTVYHPMTSPWPESTPSPYAELFPADASILDPFVWGFVPEDGSALSLRPYTEDGGWVMLIIGATGSGKSIWLNNGREWITRARDARLVQLNGAHSVDEIPWQPISALTVIGDVRNDEEARTNIAEALDKLCQLVTSRSATLADDGVSVWQPSEDKPVVGVVIDELDAILANVPGAREALDFLASKQRKSGVFLLLGAQRGVVQDIGAKLRSQLKATLVGRVRSDSEAKHGAGNMEVPDIRPYSKGEPGYFQICDISSGEVTGRGRTFLLGKPRHEPAYIKRLVAARAPGRDWSIPDMPSMNQDGGKQAAQERSAETASEVDRLRGRARLAVVATATGPGEPAVERPRERPQERPVEHRRRAPVVSPHIVPEAVMDVLMPMLANSPKVTSSEVTLALGTVGRTKAWEYMRALTDAGVVEPFGKGRAAGFRLTRRQDDTPAAPAGDADDAPPARPFLTLAALAASVADGTTDADDAQRDLLGKVADLTREVPPPAAGGDPA
jgi:hypothetical protein